MLLKPPLAILPTDMKAFNTQIDKLTGNRELISEMGEKEYRFLMENYTVEKSYEVIMNRFK